MNGVADAYENIDGIVCVAHTEGGEERTPNNLELLLRTLSGFVVNPSGTIVTSPAVTGVDLNRAAIFAVNKIGL